MSRRLTAPVPRKSTAMTDEQVKALTRAGRAYRAAKAKSDAAEAERDRLIVEMRELGVSVRAIAAACEISPQTVLNVVGRASHD